MMDKVYGFDDVIISPRESSNISLEEIDTRIAIDENFEIKIPFILSRITSSNENYLNSAISISQEGGLGCIYDNLSIDDQVSIVKSVKSYSNWIIRNPISIDIESKLSDAQSIMRENKISGLTVVDKKNNKLLGIITIRDIKLASSLNTTIGKSMISKGLITASEDAKPEEIFSLMHKNKIEKIPIVEKDLTLKGLITMKDIENFKKYPNASKDKSGRLRVLGSISTGANAIKRAVALVEAEVDGILIYSDSCNISDIESTLKTLKSLYPKITIIAGDVVTSEGAEILLDAGANALQVGKTGNDAIGVPSISAIMNIYEVCKRKDIPLIANYNFNSNCNLTKSFAAGASIVTYSLIPKINKKHFLSK